MRRPRRTLAAVAAVVALTAAACTGDGNDAPSPDRTEASRPTGPIPKKAYLKDACKLPPEWVERIHRGWAPGDSRDLDLVIVPTPPSYMGTFINTSHSGPYDFLQDVPLVFYGPGFVEARGDVEVDREVTIADLAPTYAEMMDFDFPDVPSESLASELGGDGAPALIVTAVIDGGGWNALEYWPDAWPNLARLMDEGVSIQDAIVGSSPSITPATHTNLSTGTWPRHHGVTAIAVRSDEGPIVGAFSEVAGNPGAAVMDPTISLKRPTLADLWDVAKDNEPKIGMLAAGNLQLGMIGYGTAHEGGDADIAAVLSKGEWMTNPEFYSMPEYVNTEVEGPDAELRETDLIDGEADGKWRGHEIGAIDASPAFAGWENRTIQAILDREGFGDDDVTDLFYLNYKAPDKAGHEYNMIAPEQEDTLRSVDDAIGQFVEWLDANVGEERYLFVVTADHGQTPLEAGGWPLSRPEVIGDLARRFDRIDNGQGIIEQTSASSFFAREDEMAANDVTSEEVASFLSRYTIADNIPDGEPVPDGYEDRTGERIFDAVFPGRQLPRVAACTGARV